MHVRGRILINVGVDLRPRSSALRDGFAKAKLEDSGANQGDSVQCCFDSRVQQP